MKHSFVGVASLVLAVGFLTAPWRAAFAADGERIIYESSVISSKVPVVPDPTGACAGSFAHCVDIGWNAPTQDVNGNPVAGPITYDVFRSTTSGTGYTKVTSGQITATSFEDDNVVGGTTYYYVIVAYQTVNGSVLGPSVNSGQVSATGLPIPGVPNPPTGPVAVSH